MYELKRINTRRLLYPKKTTVEVKITTNRLYSQANIILTVALNTLLNLTADLKQF